MDKPIKLIEKYERNGWPSLKRPDLKPPEGWNLSLSPRIGTTRFRSGRRTANGLHLASRDMFISYLEMAVCPKRSQTLPCPQVVRASCLIRLD